MYGYVVFIRYKIRAKRGEYVSRRLNKTSHKARWYVSLAHKPY